MNLQFDTPACILMIASFIAHWLTGLDPSPGLIDLCSNFTFITRPRLPWRDLCWAFESDVFLPTEDR